jgi:membrane protease subunit HflK
MIFNKINFAKNDGGPWGRYSGGGKSGDEGDDSKGTDGDEPKIIDIFKGYKQSGKSKRSGGSGRGGRGGNGGLPFDFSKISPAKSVFLGLMAILIIWMLSGFYKVKADENAIVLYFGKFHSISTPGLNYYVPAPFGKIIKVSVTSVNKEEFGFKQTGANEYSNDQYNFKAEKSMITRNFNAESLMLTGDENIADIDFEVQWKVGSITDYVFNVANPVLTIRKATESAMREIIAKRPIDDVLANKKSEVEIEVKNLLQEILDSYKSGVEVLIVQLLRVDPPAQVISSFRDVQTAKADKERAINEAMIYKNGILPKAKGEAEQIIQEAEGYKKSVIADAEGKASRFNKVYNEYRKARTVTRKRMYLDTMEEVLKSNEKIIIDEKAGRGVVPYLSLEKVKK